MKELAIITGGGTGIGKALALELAGNQQMDVMIVGRRKEPLQETVALHKNKISFCTANVATVEGRNKILGAIENDVVVKYLVHNAAVLHPVKRIEQLSLEEWRNHQAINVEAPLFLTQTLLSKMNYSRILNISSGAAHRALAGWAAYCSSKAALYMLYMVMNAEFKNKNILVGSVRPGVVNTPMQSLLRQSDPIDFPDLPLFIQYNEKGKLIPVEIVAQFLRYILMKTDDSQFIDKEWDIYRDYTALDEKYKR